MKDEFFGLNDNTRNRDSIQSQDKVVFYLTSPYKVFAGTATTTTNCFKLSDSEKQKLSHDSPFFTTNFGVKLTNIDVWGSHKYVPDLVNSLNFIKHKNNWGAFFQGTAIEIDLHDYSTIVSPFNESASNSSIEENDDIDSSNQFVLESHLEEFIFSNWSNMNWGRSLRLFETSLSSGRQFPAGRWIIDFLAIDNETNDLVVIELKRGQTSDATIGQVQRYMGWVRNNIAEDGQNVRGIVICHEVDDSLRYGVLPSGDVEVLTYSVKFELIPMD